MVIFVKENVCCHIKIKWRKAYIFTFKLMKKSYMPFIKPIFLKLENFSTGNIFKTVLQEKPHIIICFGVSWKP